MPLEVVHRDDPDDRPEQLGQLLQMRKGPLAARCELWTHPLGWECRLIAGEQDLIATKVCRSRGEAFAFGATWRQALEARGWQS
jgi:hypothetical protein